MDDLPADYDAIVVGTGMIESVIAAAISRVGKSVLHLDSNEFYGENWASFNLEGFENWVKNSIKTIDHQFLNENYIGLLNKNEEVVEINQNVNIWNARLNEYSTKKKNEESLEKLMENVLKVQEEVAEETKKNLKKELKCEEENLLKFSRRFNLDLCPKLLFSKGTLVQLLISSNIARYAEFKSVTRVLTWREGQLEPVPCSRADVFATKNVTVVHKRILVKILTLFTNYPENIEEFRGFENKTFLDYLKHKKLPENLTHYILYAIAMGDNTTLCLDGVKNCKFFLESLGRYGNTPFIFPMYGSGELPQCFCRLCAVFGGVYCLQRGVEAIIVKDNQSVGVISKKKRLNAKAIILSSKFVPKAYLANESSENISRGIFITNRSILSGDKESLTLLQFPPVSKVSDKLVTVIELGSGTCTCPETYYVVHMTAKMTRDAHSDLKHVIEALFQTACVEADLKPNILWSATWNMSKKNFDTKDSGLRNLKICCSIDSELDYESAICEAKKIFQELFPEEEFLPRAPDPEEIVLDVEEVDNDNKESNTPGDCINAEANAPFESCTDYEGKSLQLDSRGNIEEKQICDITKSNDEEGESVYSIHS